MDEKRNLRVAYVSMFDALDVRNWSGLDFHIWKALEQMGASVFLVDKLSQGRSLSRRCRKLIGKYIFGRKHLYFWDCATAVGFGRCVEERLKVIRADLILSANPIPVARLNTRLPIVLWTDSTFSGLLDFYPEFSRAEISPFSVRQGRRIDAWALERACLTVFSSHWAQGVAARAFPGEASKMSVVPFGANLEPLSEKNGEVRPVQGEGGILTLLFVGVDWKRKGGDFAIEVAKAIVDRGIAVKMRVVGCNVDAIDLPSWIEVVGYVSKHDEEGRRRMSRLFTTSSFLILPTKAECCAVVLAEAAAFGLPSLARNVGGTSTVVFDGVSGLLFEPQETAGSWADRIAAVWRSQCTYDRLVNGALELFRTKLNWSCVAREMIEKMSKIRSKNCEKR